MGNITDENFEIEIKNTGKPVLVDFFAEWCMPCVMMSPVLEELSEKFKGKIKPILIKEQKRW